MFENCRIWKLMLREILKIFLTPKILWHRKDLFTRKLSWRGNRQRWYNRQHIFVSTPIGLIKMDIEGTELNALKGAINTLKKCRPYLTLSAYHKTEDLITLPKFIKSVYGNFDLYVVPRWLKFFRQSKRRCVRFGYNVFFYFVKRL